MGLRYTFGSMGCPCAIELEDLPELKARAIAEAAHAEVERLNRKYSHYRDDSLLADWARAGGDEIALAHPAHRAANDCDLGPKQRGAPRHQLLQACAQAACSASSP